MSNKRIIAKRFGARGGFTPHRAGHSASHNASLKRGTSLIRTRLLVKRRLRGKRPSVAVPDLVAGFTIVELLVGISVFAIFLTVAVGVFVEALRGQRSLTKSMAVASNAGFALEEIMREARTGYWFCPNATGPSPSICEGEGNALSFKDYLGNNVTFKRTIDGKKIERNNTQFTSSNVEVEGLRFRVSQGGNVCSPWRVTIAMRVKSAGAVEVRSLDFQTSVSSRVFPVDVKEAPEAVVFSCAK